MHTRGSGEHREVERERVLSLAMMTLSGSRLMNEAGESIAGWCEPGLVASACAAFSATFSAIAIGHRSHASLVKA